MSSPTLENLRHTLESVRVKRLRVTALHHIGVALTALMALSLLLIGIDSWLSPSRNGEIALFSILVVGVIGAGVYVVSSFTRARSDERSLAVLVEGKIPDLEQRLLTSLEFSEDDYSGDQNSVSQQFVQQLWADAEEHVKQEQAKVNAVVSSRASYWSLAAASGSMAVVALLLVVSQSLFDAANRIVWPFVPEPPAPEVLEALPISISVEPGDMEMQRGDSATIVARVTNAIPSDIQLSVQSDNVNWQDYTMMQDASGSDGATYSYYMPSVREDIVYFVNFMQDGEQRSEQYRIRVYDLPKVDQIDLSFDFPEYTGLEDFAEEDSGDMLVPEGTEVELNVHFNKPIASARIEFQENDFAYESIPLAIDGSTGRANITVVGDAVYRIEAVDTEQLESVDPYDYYLRSIPDEPPKLTLRSPGRDQEVMPLEEVVLEVEADDDYGLSQFELRYNVVGQDEVAVDFLPEEKTKSIDGNELIYLEDLSVSPGDFVSYYLSLADNNALSGPAAVVSDIYFLQVVPTDQEFRQAGGGGGQGGAQGGGQSSALVTLQKDIIAATWKLRNQENIDPNELSDALQIISESQTDATTRARQSIDRLAERLNFSDDSYDNAVMNLQLAIEQMNLAIVELDKQQVNSALKPEQVALQYILKAEADINRTDISTQQASSGGGAGGAQQEREDLRELFEMEMGQLENRYETPNSRGGSQANSEEANKLEELARRQEGLTRAQRDLARRMEQMSEEQRRRELERLQREQEQLSEEVSELSRQMSRNSSQQASSNSQQQQQSPSQQASSSPSQSSGQSQTNGQSEIERAAQQMQEAAQAQTPAQAAARSQRALESLREQQRQLNEQQSTSVTQLAQNAVQKGQQLAAEQRQLQQDLEALNRQQGLGQTRNESRSDEQLQELLERQRQQRQEVEDIENMLRAIIARGENDDQALMAEAQRAARTMRPLREAMSASQRLLSNGMVNIAVDIEQEVGDTLEELERSLRAMDPADQPSSLDPVQQAARDASELREQMEQLQRQAGEMAEGNEANVSVAQMRQQLARSQQLAQDIASQMQQQRESGQRGTPNGQQQGQGSEQQGSANGQNNSSAQRQGGGGGAASALSTARTIRSDITAAGVEDFLNQPELFAQLMKQIVELESTLRAQAELARINEKIYAPTDEDVPDQYQRLVEQYYRVLSETSGEGGAAPVR
ncbi:MAG: DUF4175 family protein [Pseudohongiellaceae bacterium]|nr:DUF4175 family protein [Pseudohongiellaceae bacterium]